MSERILQKDERGISEGIGYILTFSISIGVILTLSFTGVSAFSDATEFAYEEEAESTVYEVAITINEMDRTISQTEDFGGENEAGVTNVSELRESLIIPEVIGSASYTLELEEVSTGGSLNTYEIHIDATNIDEISVPVTVDGDLEIDFDSENNVLRPSNRLNFVWSSSGDNILSVEEQ